MDAHHAVVDLAAIAVVLPRGADRFLAALGDAGLVYAADGLDMCVVPRHDLLAAISQLLFIPLDRLEKSLQGARRGSETQGDRLGGLAVQVGELPLNVNPQQRPSFKAAETIGKQRQERS